MVKLFEPMKIGEVLLKNRIVMAPMCMYSCHNEDGQVEHWHEVHYTTRAVGQVGLIIVEATAVHPQGRISAKDLGIWDDQHIDGLKNLVTRMKEHGAKTGIQLAHAGRKATVEGPIYGPSSIAFDDQSRTPNEMTEEDIEQTIIDFQEAARRTREAGFDVLEIHAAHGYLIHSFLSPLSNTRKDQYGGTPVNRYRFLAKIIRGIRKEWNGPLFVRISASDYHAEGMDVSQYIEMVEWMKEQGVDLIDVSSGGLVLADIDAYPGYQVPFAEQIKHQASIETGAVGLITTGIQAEEILKSERADLVFLGRELLRTPYWPFEAAKELRTEIESPSQYKRGWI